MANREEGKKGIGFFTPFLSTLPSPPYSVKPFISLDLTNEQRENQKSAQCYYFNIC